jgi:hypothetical protein
VRHLDTVNYRSYMEESATPSGDSVYDSKRGYWRYSMQFLLNTGARCGHVPPPSKLATLNQKDEGALCFARTNAEKSEDVFSFTSMVPSMPDGRLAEWCSLKAVILEFLLVQNMSYETAQKTMQEEYDFRASTKEFRKVLHLWYSQGQIAKCRRESSVDREGDQGSPEQFSNDGGNLERIPTFDSDLGSIVEEPQLRRTLTASSFSSAFADAAKDASVAVAGNFKEAFRLKKQRDRRAISQPTAPTDQLNHVLPRQQTVAQTQTTSSDTVTDSYTSGPPADEEHPPPYTPDGWIWP